LQGGDVTIMRKKPLAAGLTFLGLAVIGFILPRVLRTTIILKMGIVIANNFNWLFAPFAVLSFIMLAFAFIPAPIRSVKKKARDAQENGNSAPHTDTLKPDKVRAMLKECREKHPGYANLYSDCMKQINHMTEQQESFEKLIQLNNADFLQDAKSTLKLAEQTILRNLMTAVNRGIVEKTDKMIDKEKGINFKNLIERVLSANEKVFETNQRFLIRASNAVSSKKAGISSNADTEAWIQALEGLVLPSDIFDTKGSH
jgi:hypothetical protein